MRRISGQVVYLAAVVVGSCLLAGYFLVLHDREPTAEARAGPSRLRLEEIPFDGARAYQYLEQVCDLGPRVSGSAAMESQRKLLAEHFAQHGADVQLQEFRVRHPLDGSAVAMANLVAKWHPARPQRVLVSAHYDTRPYPDRDRFRPRGVFIGANDGASGVALLMELARHMPELGGRRGVDFVLFDGEELVYRENDAYFLGSTYFARQYAANPPGQRYLWGVLLDMVGDADLQIYQERNSVAWRDTRPLVEDIWATARRLGVREFIGRPRHTIRDDHLPLRNIGRIPTCVLIDFDYPFWHTAEDKPDRCSALSLAKVGWVVHEWLKTAVQ